MHVPFRATSLALLLASGVWAAPPAPPTLQPASAESVVRATRQLLEQRAKWGLGPRDDLKLEHSRMTPEGRSLLRFNQTFQGARVFGSQVVAALHPDDSLKVQAQALEAGLEPEGTPTLTPDEARQVSHRALLPVGAYEAQPEAELIVFPTRFTGGLRPRLEAGHDPVWDRETSVLAPRPAARAVWAYEVVSSFRSAEDGVRDMHLIVDARTGDVLRRWDAAPAFLPKGHAAAPRTYGDLARAAAPMKVSPSLAGLSQVLPVKANPAVLGAAAATEPQPATGLGLSQYSGSVALSTATNPDLGGFDLWDLTRSHSPNKVWLTTGQLTLFNDIATGNLLSYARENQAGSFDNHWGDGAYYKAPVPELGPDGQYYIPRTGWHHGDANDQTAAVDAHFAAGATYDMYRNVLGRLGLDGQDSGIISAVHLSYQYANAYWDTRNQLMAYGDGDYPFNPTGFTSLTSLDIGGHEMSHGVMASEAALEYIGESGGLNEANSDMMSQAVVAYARRVATDPVDKIPPVHLSWKLGEAVSPIGTPLRWMYKPSLDGVSPDFWFHGMSMLDVHYTSGAGNRMFYFLANGAPASSTSASYSPYLPGGMTGIGLDAATRIWYRGMTEYFTPTTDYHGARTGCLKAAMDLYGAGSDELAAVENAFAAINVGAAHGQPERPLVTFPQDLVDPDSPLVTETGGSFLDGVFVNTPVVPAGAVLKLHAHVDHATDPSLTWKSGIAMAFRAPNLDPLDVMGTNGSFDDQGYYHAPVAAPLFAGVRAFSKQDPLEFAANMVFVAHMDADGDTEQDAMDGGLLALVWHIKSTVVDHIAAKPDPEAYGSVDDVSLQLWIEAFKNAFVKK